MKTKFLRLISLFFLLLPVSVVLLGVGCKDDDSISVCGVEEPLTNLSWLKDLKADIEEDSEITSSVIALYSLDNVDYIYVQNHFSSAYEIPNTIFDCEGNEKYKCGGNQPVDSCTTFFSEAQKTKTLW